MDNRISVAVKAVIQSGVSISEAYIDEAGHLVLVLSNKDSTDLGLVTDKESASAAHAAAEEALAVAAAAEEKVGEVSDVAAEAKGTADEAKATADGIAGTAQEAKDIAAEAKGTADEAKATADGIAGTAQEAKDIAAEAKGTVDEAKDIAEEAKTTAEEAKELANDMQVDLYDSVAALRTGKDVVAFSQMTASGSFRVLKGTAGLPDANNAYLVGQWCYAYESGANRYIRFAANISGSDSSNFALYYSADGGTPSWHKMT